MLVLCLLAGTTMTGETRKEMREEKREEKREERKGTNMAANNNSESHFLVPSSSKQTGNRITLSSEQHLPPVAFQLTWFWLIMYSFVRSAQGVLYELPVLNALWLCRQ